MTSPLPFALTRQLKWQLAALRPEMRRAENQAHHQLLVLPYRLEALAMMLRLEQNTQPLMLLIEQQPEIKLGMRPLLLDFLMEVICILLLLPLTFPLTVNLIDRYCLTRIVKKQHYQLLGLTCLWIACKNLDAKYKIPTLHDLRKICVDYYYPELFLEMEKHVLKSLEWRVSGPTVDQYVDVYVDILAHHPLLAKALAAKKMVVSQVLVFLAELFQFYPNLYFEYPPSKLALIAVLTALLTTNASVNVATCLTTINLVVKSEQFADAADLDLPRTEDILTPHQFRTVFTLQFFKLVAKMVLLPPKALTIKYFGDATKFPHFKGVVDAMLRALHGLVDPPVTPKGVTAPPQLPLTPVLNLTLPKLELPLSPMTLGSRKRNADDAHGPSVKRVKQAWLNV